MSKKYLLLVILGFLLGWVLTDIFNPRSFLSIGYYFGTRSGMSEKENFCDGLYYGVLGSTHAAFEAHMVGGCFKYHPVLKDLLENVYRAHKNDECSRILMGIKR